MFLGNYGNRQALARILVSRRGLGVPGAAAREYRVLPGRLAARFGGRCPV
jgi:hypothetical protein